MRCKKIQRLILADYTDREMTGPSRRKVTDHIRTCADCRELEERVKERIIAPLRQTGHVQPPEEVWLRIKRAIEGPERESVRESIADFLNNLLRVRKPVFAAGYLLVLVIAGGIFATTYFSERNAVNVYLEEQLDFLDSLDNGNGDTDEYNGFFPEDIFL
ncbi:MAG: zf-HC2 domain-containing protein [Candidatus Omnitrophota bacterium]